MASTRSTRKLHSDVIYWLQCASTMAYAKELVMLIRGRPECSKRAAWVVEFDRSMDQARRVVALRNT